MTIATITFRLAGPQQAWSAAGRGAHRSTQDHPTKSGVIGLVANALGRDRTDDITDLAALRLGVRADEPGHIESEYHTSGGGNFPLLPAEVLADPALARAVGKGKPAERLYAAPKNIKRDKNGVLVGNRASRGKPAVIQTRDEYLVGAVFTIALTGERVVLEQIADALRAPARSLHLGRKAYPLSAPPRPAIHPVDDPATAFDAVPPAAVHGGPCTTWIEQPPGWSAGDTQIVVDQPTRFDTRRTVPRLETRHLGTLPGAVDFFTPEDQP